MQILIIQTAFLGDVILATALIEKLIHRYPSAVIDFLVKNGNEKVLGGHPHLSEILIFDKKNKTASLINLLGRIRKKKYDLVVNVHRHFSSGLLTLLSGAKKTIGFKKNPLSWYFSLAVEHEWNCHETSRNQKLIETLTDAEPAQPKLYPSVEDKKFVTENFPKPYISISPCSIWPTKELPLERWANMLNALAADKKVYLLGGPDDGNICEKIKMLTNHPNVEILAGKLGFMKDVVLMSRAEMNYVLDSAALHICSATNAAVTAVYCSTSTRYGFGPLSDLSIIIESPEKLKCRPCGAHGYKKCPEGHFKCGNIEIII